MCTEQIAKICHCTSSFKLHRVAFICFIHCVVSTDTPDRVEYFQPNLFRVYIHIRNKATDGCICLEHLIVPGVNRQGYSWWPKKYCVLKFKQH